MIGDWRRPLRDGRETEEFSELCRCCVSVRLNEGDDSWRWELNTIGKYTVASLRFAFDGMWLRRGGRNTRWNKFVPSKVRIHYWRVCLDRLPTKANLEKKGVEMDSTSCPLYDDFMETKDHLFVSCSRSKEVRKVVCVLWKDLARDGSRLGDIITHVSSSANRSSSREIIEDMIWHAYLWHIWKGRNEVVFNNASFNPRIIANDIQSTTFFWFQNRCPFGRLVSWTDWCCNSVL